MTHFARNIRYGGYDGEDSSSFTALIEFAMKKGGSPSGFAIYYRILNHSYPDFNKTRMLRIEARTAEEAQEFWPWGASKGVEKKFPGFDSDRWEKTTRWLDRVALGHEGMWVRVGTPSPCSARRKRKLRFGNISQILRIRELQLAGLEQEYEDNLQGLLDDRSDLEVYCEGAAEGTYVPKSNQEEYAHINREIEEIQAIFDAARFDILATKEEMRHVVRQKFPEPLGKSRKRDLFLMGLSRR